MSTFNNVSGLLNANESNLFPIRLLPSAIRDSRYLGTTRVRVFQTTVPSGAGLASVPPYQSQRRTDFGEDHCLLSSGQSNLATDSKQCLILTIVSKVFLFGLPDEHRARFESLCVDQFIYTSRWCKHVSETVGDLRQEILRILVLLIANILKTQISSLPTSGLTKLSSILCVLGLIVTLVLLREQRRLIGTNATTSAVYLDDLNTSYGFQLISIIHSLPQALFVWALLLFAVQHFWMTFSGIFPTSTSLLVTTVLLVACVGIWAALHTCLKSSGMPRYRYLRLRRL